MFRKLLRKFTKSLRSISSAAARNQRRKPLVLEILESRDLPAPLTWAAGVNLPTP